MAYYFYILHSKSSDTYYQGSSEDPWKRIVEHNTSENDTYTSKHRPWELKAVFEAGETRAEALAIERWVKKQKSRTLLEKLIDPDFIPTGKLAKLVRVPHVRD